MITYINNTSDNMSIIESHEHCAIQPYLSGNYQIDLLLRNHNWAGGINTPIALNYKITTDINEAHAYQRDYWHGEGNKLRLTINHLGLYLQEIQIYKEKFVDYIEDDDNRDAYQLYENNFASSFSQIEYTLSIQFENIKQTIKLHSEHELAKQFSWLVDVNSIYDIDLNKLNIPSEELKDDTDFLFNASYVEPTVSKAFSHSKFNSMVQYIFNAMSSVANIKFNEVSKGENISIVAKVTAPYNSKNLDDYFSIEDFDYSSGKTHHVSLRGNYQVNNKPVFTQMDFPALLHGIGHIMIDHPNDANIAIRKYLLPPDHDWSKRSEDYGISNEYRADNGCMSVMAFTNCFYQGKAFNNTLTYMPIDIQALQYIYGKNEHNRAGDTTYILTEDQTFVDDMDYPLFPMDIPAGSIYTLYDAGGINTIDLSQAKEAKIDLNEGAGHFNAVGDNIFLIAYGVELHNVIVGAGDIEIKLNSLSNSIKIPSKGAHVKIEGFTSNDKIILADNANQNLEFTGCIRPYSSVGDNDTEICFI